MDDIDAANLPRLQRMWERSTIGQFCALRGLRDVYDALGDDGVALYLAAMRGWPKVAA